MQISQNLNLFRISYSRSSSLSVVHYEKCLSRGPEINITQVVAHVQRSCYSVMWGLVDTSCHLALTMPLVRVATTHETVL